MFIYNKGQKRIINEAVDWFFNSSKQVYQFAGDPGTGKSVVLNAIISEICNKGRFNMNDIAPMSFTGAAAIVMRLKGLVNARSIHSWLKEPVIVPIVDNLGNPVMNTYYNRQMVDIMFIPRNISNIRLMVIDEARMVPLSMKEDIESRGIKILVAGDKNQLDPVEPGGPAYLRDEDEIPMLDEIMRQEEGNGIIYISQRAKLGLPVHFGLYNNVWVCTEKDLNDMILSQSEVILCGKNVTREKYNGLIREKLGYKTDIPQYGEKVICRKNNWTVDVGGINLANGLAGRVVNYPSVSGYDGKSFSIDFAPLLFNGVFQNLQCDYDYLMADHHNKKILIRSKYNRSEKFEFGYALTTHLAQGSQYRNGIYFEEYLHPSVNNKINFTAVTRFSQSMIYVKPEPKLYYQVQNY